MFKKIQEMVEWTFLSNVFSVQSDCPHREKFGYGGDLVTTAEAYIYNYNMANFYEKTVRDFTDAARSNGGMTECAPYNGIQARGLGGGTGPVGWQLAHPFLQAKLYQFYGDKRIIEEQYAVTKRLIDFLHDQAGDELISIGISDHSSIAKKPEALTSAAFYYHHVELLSQFAQLLGREADSEKYSELAAEIQKKFIRKFLDTETGYYDTGTQACQVFPLYYDLVPDVHREAVINVLTYDILQKQKGHLTTGIFGTKMLFDVMRLIDNEEIAYKVANQKSFPGWGYMLENGATTLWENWRYSDNVYSHNHPMFGSISEWFYRSLVGINPAPDASGFDRIIISPAVIEDLEWVKGSYRSIRGEITSHWSKQNGDLRLNLSIPANTTATVFLPAVNIDRIFEGGVSVAGIEDISVQARGERGFAIEIGSGGYSFRSVGYRE
jgi:alpha-L-rhamnosidase